MLKMKQVAALAVALGCVCGSSGATVWAQNQDMYHGVAQPAINAQRQAESAAASTGSATKAESVAPPKSAAEKWWVDGRVQALFIAAQNYDGAAGLRSLKGAANDASILKTWFDSAYDKGESTVLGDDETLRASATPTRENIMKALKEKADVDCERLIVTFAGHGISFGGKSFLCPIDAKGKSFDGVEEADEDDPEKVNERNAAILRKGDENNLIAVADVLDVLKNAKAKEVVAIFDACRDSQGGEDNGFTREFVQLKDEAFQRENNGKFFVLTSCATGETAKEHKYGGKQHGAFTYYFVEGLQGKADFAECFDGYVTLNEAYNYAQSRVRGEQSPEFFMASAQLADLPTMTRVNLDDFALGGADLAEVDALSDAKFLLRSGFALSKSNLMTDARKTGAQALDAALENAPNNRLALSLRGSVRRSLGDFEGALSDLSKVGGKLQLYVKSLRPEYMAKPENAPQTKFPGYPEGYVAWPDGVRPPREGEWAKVELVDDKSEKTGETAETLDLLTVTKILKNDAGDQYFWVTEKNNVPLGEKAGWVRADALTWHHTIAANMVNASRLNPLRSPGVNSGSGGMIRPGRDNPRPVDGPSPVHYY